ncbi:MAG: tetratricopeptide repeat protein [Actinomycetota bacterium]|nr:tetratricopeptide repeat protein [Actinomycetota bacterium]
MELSWRSARIAGNARRWLTSGWRRPTLWVAGTGAALYGVHRWFKPFSWFSFWSVLALAVIAAFALALWRARKRVVIEAFVDYNKAAGLKEGDSAPIAPGLNDALVSELAVLRELYRAVGERAEVDPALGSAGSRPVDATLELQDVSGFLQNASTGDATVSVGPLALPIGTVLAMLGRLAQGPRVTGGLQLVATPDDDGAPRGEVVLTAYYTGLNRSASWSVREPLPEYAEAVLKIDSAASVVQTAAVRTMVQELAARIFADLALEGTRSWRATRRFLEGLRQFRLAHESQQDRVLKLRRAERAFIEGLADDVDLPLARYNLGVVYLQLANEATEENFSQAAENAFRRELQRKQPSWQPYYALAVTCFEQGRYADVSSLCDRVIELADGATRRALAYDLKGLADRRRDNSALGLAKAIESWRRAVGYALLALFSAELTSDDAGQARGVAARCLLDLGIGLAYAGLPGDGAAAPGVKQPKQTLDECRRLISLAAGLEDSLGPRFELGKIAFAFGDPQLAIRELRAAVRIDPTSAVCWGWLAMVNASLSAAAADPTSKEEWRKRANEAITLARANLDFSYSASDPPTKLTSADYEIYVSTSALDAINQLASALDDLGQPDEAANARQIPYVEVELEPETDVAVLAARLAAEPEGWSRGKIAMRIGDLLRNEDRHAESADFYRQALRELEAGYGAEAQRLGIQGMVALALASQDPPNAPLHEALREAQRSITVDPLSFWEREALGSIYETIGDYVSAIGAYEDALFSQPNNPSLHTLLGNAHLSLAYESSDDTRRKESYKRAIAHLESALALQPQSDLAGRTAAHFALGGAHKSADELDRAIPHFRNALPDSEVKPIAQALMGEAYVRMKHYNEAEKVLSEVIEDTKAAVKKKPREAIGSLDPPWLVGETAAYAHRMLAMSFIDRDIRLDEARSHIQESERLLDRLKEDASAADRASGRELEGRILLEEGDHDAAIASLNESVGLSADVEAYFHLGRAYKAKAASSRRKAERELALKRARRAYQHAQDLSRSELFRQAITSDVAELDALSPTARADPDEAATEEPPPEPPA